MKFFLENKGQTIMITRGNRLEFGAHLHAHLELVYMLDGQTKVLVDAREHLLQAGDVLIVFPNQVHQYLRIGLESYILAIFPPEICPDLQGIFKSKLPVDPVIRQAAANPHLLPALLRILELDPAATIYTRTITRGCFLILLGELLPMMAFADAPAADSNALPAIIRFCQDNFAREIHLRDIAAALHLSTHYMSHLFSQKLNLKLSDYIGILRISEACRLLGLAEKSITEIGFEVGFKSPRSFNRLFIKHVGLTPREYRRQIQAGG